MNTRSYPIWLEVSGPFGMFADSTAGSEAYSFPLPPMSACLGMIASIHLTFGVGVKIVAVGICQQPRWQSYSYNSFAVTRKKDLVIGDNALQIHEAVLIEPCFQILALLHNAPATIPSGYVVPSQNPAHMMQDHFMRRLRNGRYFRPVSLGRKEFLASYVGPHRSKILTNYESVIPSMCVATIVERKIAPQYRQNLHIKQGVLHYSPDVPVGLRDGVLSFGDDLHHHQVTRLSYKQAS